jgi:hypothetical protein
LQGKNMLNEGLIVCLEKICQIYLNYPNSIAGTES